MHSTTTSVAAQSASSAQLSSRGATPVAPLSQFHFSQSMHIRYELCRHTGHLKTIYRDGYSVIGYDTIDQFYADMATEGWQVDSTQQACSCSLYFSVLKRAL